MVPPPAAPQDLIEEVRGDVTFVRTDPNLPPVAIIDRSPITTRHRLTFGAIAVLGAVAWAMIAFLRGETVNAVWFVLAAICTYVIGFRFYARLIEMKIVRPRDDHATPAEIYENGTDYMPTDRRVLFGHHFAAIAGAGPLVGPVLAIQMGYLPGTIWIIIGAVLAGCVQDYLVLAISTRRRGRSLGQMARDELGPVGGTAAIVGVLVIMMILLAVLGLVVVNALGLSGQPITPAEITDAAAGVGEQSIVSRTGGAPTLAFGMAQVLSVFGGSGLKAFWYHFAIMFEALFILTTIDAGTRVARFMLSDGLSNLGGPMRRLHDPSWKVGAWVCSIIVVAAWGSILLMGVTDPLGGINTLFPLFGIANQLLAAIALTVVTVVVIKMGLLKWAWIPGIPLLWDLVVTLTASWQKIFSGDPKLGYWTQHFQFRDARDAGKTSFGAAKNPDQLQDVIRNTFIQGTLSILFATVVLIVVASAIVMTIRSMRGRGRPLAVEPPVPSRIFGPSRLLATPVEKEVQKQWDTLAESPVRSVGTSAR